MGTAIVENQVNEKSVELDAQRVNMFLPGSLTNLRERLAALSPAVIIGIIMSGFNGVIVSLLVSGCSLGGYYAYRKLKKQDIAWSIELFYYMVLLLAVIPSTITWWISILAGLGITFLWIVFEDKAPFNLTLALWIIIAIWVGGSQIFGTRVEPEQMPYFKLYIVNTTGGIGEFFLPAIIGGGFYLLYKKVISWIMVLGFIGTVIGLSAIGGENPIMHFLSGSLVLGVVFLTPDLQKLSRRINIFYGIMGGFLAIGFRYFGDFLTAVPLAILIMDWILVIKHIELIKWKQLRMKNDKAKA